MLTRRSFLELMGGAALATMLPWPAWAAGTRKPNIVVLLADDMGYGEGGMQGGKDIPTPNIDAIAAAGIRFTDGYVSCPVCAPTRAGLMSGRYQQRYGFEFNPGREENAAEDFGLPRDQGTIAEHLKPAGYATGIVGKWHLGYKADLQPTARGFDEFFGFLGGANVYEESVAKRMHNPIMRGTEVVEEKEYLTDAFAREAVNFIERHAAHPFFLYLAFNAVHSPLQAGKYLARFPDIEDKDRRTYAGMTAAMDDAIGQVMATLRKQGIEEDTLVFFLSDNGGPTRLTTSRNTPLSGYKGDVLEGGVRIPFAMQWKGHLPAGKVDHRPVISLDIHATALAAAGVAIDPAWKLDGVNLLPFLDGHTPDRPHETLCWRFGSQHAIRHGDWKLVTKPHAGGLYNLADDIGESTDLSAGHPDKVKELTALYAAWNADNEDSKWGRNEKAGKEQGEGKRFKRFDKNGDHVLTSDEVPNQRFFEQMDANKDGKVTPDEAREEAMKARQK